LNKEQAKKLAIRINKQKPNWILIEGGEPFLRKDLFEIIKNLKPRINTNKRKLDRNRNPFNPSNPWLQKRPIYIITSGHGFNEELAKKCKNNGVKLMISLDSVIKKTYEKIRKGAHFNDAINAIKIANKYIRFN
jgi:MoaA/NifB/PqqE/SkfB family radical SAM enzyme